MRTTTLANGIQKLVTAGKEVKIVNQYAVKVNGITFCGNGINSPIENALTYFKL